MEEDAFVIGGVEIGNRLILGSGKYGDDAVMGRAIEEAGIDMVTVALRRVDPGRTGGDILDWVPRGRRLLPNTSGARNAAEAVRIARLAREAGQGNFVKIEIVTDQVYLLPDNAETLKATETLAKEGFIVMPYLCPDPVLGRSFEDAGAAALMPLGSPIGSNRGLGTRELVRIMVEFAKVPVIVDAGIGKPSEAAACMEIGVAGVMANTAIATAGDPVAMAVAFSQAVQAGRRAFLARPGRVLARGAASSPLTGFLGEASA